MTGALRPGGWLLAEDADPMLQPAGQELAVAQAAEGHR